MNIYIVLLPFFTFIPWIIFVSIIQLYFSFSTYINNIIFASSIIYLLCASICIMFLAYRENYIQNHKNVNQDIILNSDEYKKKVIPKGILNTISPILFIFTIIITLIELFPGWSAPFSNTLGYLFTKNKFMNIFSKYINSMNTTDELSLFITKLYNDDICMFINLFVNESNPIENPNSIFNKLISNFQNGKEKNISYEDKVKLAHLIRNKHFIGKIIWYIFACIITFYVLVTHLYTFKI